MKTITIELNNTQVDDIKKKIIKLDKELKEFNSNVPIIDRACADIIMKIEDRLSKPNIIPNHQYTIKNNLEYQKERLFSIVKKFEFLQSISNNSANTEKLQTTINSISKNIADIENGFVENSGSNSIDNLPSIKTEDYVKKIIKESIDSILLNQKYQALDREAIENHVQNKIKIRRGIELNELDEMTKTLIELQKVISEFGQEEIYFYTYIDNTTTGSEKVFCRTKEFEKIKKLKKKYILGGFLNKLGIVDGTEMQKIHDEIFNLYKQQLVEIEKVVNFKESEILEFASKVMQTEEEIIKIKTDIEKFKYLNKEDLNLIKELSEIDDEKINQALNLSNERHLVSEYKINCMYQLVKACGFDLARRFKLQIENEQIDEEYRSS